MQEELEAKDITPDQIIVGLARLLPKRRGRPRLIHVSRLGVPVLSLEGLIAGDWYKVRVSVLGESGEAVVLLLEPVWE